ncbi:AsnC family transcriptional regulator [Stella humosa]|uniref:AsnC family transcriptional regulator n=1 Tax=Stella humosa TaxID=94 RepID=A0A3N1KR48_9PROT|nr:Lrp/AsnC family transcriptional regulator [Stella humosa]ROP84303.1 AsnC family transcriptional regulator [Stella humosa]BBK33816.1 ArsR family transcriptional regulator [Stella humosa]
MDAIDLKILALLQEDGGLSNADIAERVGLSATPCWRRIRHLEETGVIRRRVALLDRDRLNVGVTVFVNIRTNQHNPEWLARFASAVDDIPEVVEFYRMAGDVDYLLRIVVPDIAAYDGVYKRLIAAIDLYDVSSSFAMEEIKYTTALPLAYVKDRSSTR